MGRYCNYQDVVNRFRKATDVNSYQTAIESNYILFAEAELDGRLGGYFTVPFSSNNVTAKDLSIDLSYAKIIIYADPKVYKSIMDQVDKRIDALISGDAYMLTTSQDQLESSAASDLAWSNTASYNSAFAMVDAEFLHIDSNQQAEAINARW